MVYFSNKLKKITNSSFPRNTNIEFASVASNFEQVVLNSFENKAFLGKPDFCLIFKHLDVQLKSNLKRASLETNSFTRKKRHKSFQNHFKFDL